MVAKLYNVVLCCIYFVMYDFMHHYVNLSINCLFTFMLIRLFRLPFPQPWECHRKIGKLLVLRALFSNQQNSSNTWKSDVNITHYSALWPFLSLRGKQSQNSREISIFKKKIPLRIHQTFRQNHTKDIKCFNIWHKHFSMSHFHVTILKHIAQKQIMDLFFL